MARCLLPHLSLFIVLGPAIPCVASDLLYSEPGVLLTAATSDAARTSAPLRNVADQEAETTTSLWSQAKAAMDKGDFSEARRLLRHAVQLDPKDGALWFHLGVSCVKINELDNAITAFEQARMLAPQKADTYFNLGLMYWKKANLNKAKELYRAGLALRPNETSAL